MKFLILNSNQVADRTFKTLIYECWKIYNSALNGVSNFRKNQIKMSDFLKIILPTGKEFLLIALNDKEKALGFSSLKLFEPKFGLMNQTSEHSIYVEPTKYGQGLGSNLLKRTIIEAHKSGFENMIARVSSNNTASLMLHNKYSFNIVGILPKVAKSLNNSEENFRSDLVYMQLQLKLLDMLNL